MGKEKEYKSQKIKKEKYIKGGETMSRKKFLSVRLRIVSLLLLCFFVRSGMTAKNVAAAEAELTEEELRQRYEDSVELAEKFRTDESFVHSFTFSAEEEVKLQTLLVETVCGGANDSDEVTRLFHIRKYVKERLVPDPDASDAPESTYHMLCENTGTSAVSYSCIAQAVRDLCLLDEISCFRLYGSSSTLKKGYEMLMIYADQQWWFVDVAEDVVTSADFYGGLVGAEDACTSFGGAFTPSMIAFDYDYYSDADKTLKGAPSGVYVSKTAWKGNGGYTVFYEKTEDKIKMRYLSNDRGNIHCYGSNKSTDAQGNAPSGLVEYAQWKNGGEGVGNYVNAKKGYLQYGVALRGRVIVDGVEYNFNEKGNLSTLPWYQAETRPFEGKEREKHWARVDDQKEQAVKIVEALCADPDYFFDLYYNEEELAYLNEVLEEIFASEDENLSEKEKAIKILQYINSHVTYQWYDLTSYDCYETLTRGTGNCSEFSICFRDLCILSGIDCFCIVGSNDNSNLYYTYGDGTEHGWNLARLDGVWYFVEPQYTKIYYEFDEFYEYFPVAVSTGYIGEDGLIAISKEGLEFCLKWPVDEMLCYQFEEDGELAIYARTIDGVCANYDGSHDISGQNYSTDENGKLKSKNGFVTWEETVITTDGKEVHTWQGYLRQGYLCMGPTVINGELYEFSIKKHYATLDGFLSTGREIAIKPYYRIGAMDIEKIADAVYTGDEICPKPVIKNGDTVLVEGRDYEIISYRNNQEVTPSYSSGASCVIEGKGDYYDTAIRYFKILTRDISDMDVFMEWNERTWSRKLDEAGTSYGRPEVSVDVPKSDYTVSYSRFDAAGEGEITITGRYNCTGRIKKTCALKPMELTGEAFAVTFSCESYPYTGAAHEPDVTIKWLKEDGTFYRNLSVTEYDVTYENNVKAGKAKVIIDGRGKFAGRLEAEFLIRESSAGEPESGEQTPSTETPPTETPSTESKPTESGTVVLPSPEQTQKPDSTPQKPIWTENPPQPVKSKLMKPGKPVIKRLKKQKGKKVKLILSKKVFGATGYQVAYATKSSMKGQKIKSFKGASVTIKGLKKKKTYYFRVRAYAKKNGEIVYGGWGKKKSIK